MKRLIKKNVFTRLARISKEELYKLDAIEIYKMVLTGELKIFPKGY